MPPEIDYDKSVAWGICVDLCAEDVFFGAGGLAERDERKRPGVTYPEACSHCCLCAQACPERAITVRTPWVMRVPYQ